MVIIVLVRRYTGSRKEEREEDNEIPASIVISLPIE